MIEIEIFDCEQNSPEWFECRKGIPTASEFSKVLAQGRTKGSESVTRRKYLLTLAGQILTGEVVKEWEGNEHTERGHEMEDEARQFYAFQRDADPKRVGFVRRGRAGASPDSLIDDKGILEIKTKLPHLQLEVLEQGRLPPEHVAQVQGQLWVSGREFCDFVSYWPRLPLFVTRVFRDEIYIAELATAIDRFNAEIDAIVARYSPAELKEAA